MLHFDWQILLSLACVSLAGIVLIRRIVGLLRGEAKSGCGTGSCGGCSPVSSSANLPVVTLATELSANNNQENALSK